MRGKIIAVLALIFANLSSGIDVGITSDTLNISTENHVVSLKHPFVLEPILKLSCTENKIPEYELDKIQGVLHFEKPDSSFQCIIKYRYLIEVPPIQIGPRSLSLPTLEDLSLNQPKESKTIIEKVNNETQSSLITTGTVFRSIQVSPLGGTDFTGGLQLQIQGKLTDKTEVTGVLSDRNLSIQPEGTTQSLEEIDKIYLKIGHPNFEIFAGDIIYKKQTGTFHSIQRKLNGMMGNFHKGQWNSSAVFAKSEGKYHKKLFNGTEGKQGPYYLTSTQGSRNIVVQAGTETVWLDGEKLVRGENRDYIIDYSIGELTFTPKRLIHFDSEIFVEYQYSDFQYNQQVSGSTVKYTFSNNNEFQISWFHEHDVYQNESSESYHLELLKNSGDETIQITGAVEDEEGQYILVDSIYVFSTDSDSTRYNVHFYQDQTLGSYRRTVHHSGIIYFEYVPEEERGDLVENIDLYTPFKQLLAPKDHDILQSTLSLDLMGYGNVEIEMALSDLDNNALSNVDDNDNTGFAHQIKYSSSELSLPGDFDLKVHVANRNKNNRYSTVQRDKPITYDSDWNIESVENLSENQITGMVTVFSDSIGELDFGWEQLELGRKKYKRLNSNISLQMKGIPKFNTSFNQVSTDAWTFTQQSTKVLLLNGNFHPFLSYENEHETGKSKFEHSAGGIQWDTDKGSLSMGLGNRTDWAESLEEESIKTHSGVFGELDWEGKSSKGWKQNIVFRQRILKNYENNINQSYNLWRINLGYHIPRKPIQWDLQAKMEETFIENRAVVYDSVGVGFGTHRYDESLNEYIPDPNGAFIAYTVLTGVRKPSTNIVGSQKLIFNMKRGSIKALHPFIFRFTGTVNYQGNNAQFDQIFIPTLFDSTITQSRWIFKQETNYNSISSSRKIYQWYQHTHHFNGLDPRGQDLRTENKIGVDLFEPITKNLHGLLYMNLSGFKVTSGYSILRNRSGDGIWLESGIKYKAHSNKQIDILILTGKTSGKTLDTEFHANSLGLRCNVSWSFTKSNRLQFLYDYNIVSEKNGLETIPPEVLNGLPVGNSLRSSIQSNIMFGDNWSFISSINYINDRRYEHFISFNSELRVLL